MPTTGSTTADHEAVEAIRQLKARYFRLLDTKDWAGLAHVFAHEISVDIEGSGDGPRDTTGPAFVEGVAGILADAVTVHHGHMPEIRLTSPTTATGVWAMEDKIWWPEGSAVGATLMHGYGHYHETYALTESGWAITTMRLTRLRVDFEALPAAG